MLMNSLIFSVRIFVIECFYLFYGARAAFKFWLRLDSYKDQRLFLRTACTWYPVLL